MDQNVYSFKDKGDASISVSSENQIYKLNKIMCFPILIRNSWSVNKVSFAEMTMCDLSKWCNCHFFLNVVISFLFKKSRNRMQMMNKNGCVNIAALQEYEMESDVLSK